MSEQEKESKSVEKSQESYLNTVIGCISDRNQARIPIQDSSITNLYGKADSMIKELDSGINLCKKYNEAKINRKYEIIIHDLQTEIKRLQDNLKLEQDARSPTKKHVSDILEKLVQLRAENQALQKDNQELKDKIKSLEGELFDRATALSKIQNQQLKGTIQRLPPLGNSSSLAEGVKEYLKDRQQVRKITKNPVTKLEKLLNQLRPKLWNWNIGNLLQQIDKWSEGVREKEGGEIDMWRIRSSIARKFSDYMDNPQRLLRPSVGSQQSLWQKLQQKNSLNSVKFSYLGSRRSLNASFH